MKRRDFLSSAAAAAVLSNAALPALGQSADAESGIPLLTVSGSAQAASRIPRVTSPGTMRGDMLYRELGSTGEHVSLIGMGGAHLGQKNIDDAEAIRLIHQGLDRGINFLDNCWDYNDGRSEERMGMALSQGGYRKKAFLMTKIDGRTKDLAASQIDTSLQRLKTDHLDLLQHHEILRYEDPDRVFEPGGSMEAVLEAKKAGKVRYIGFTGHKDPHIHLYMLEVARHYGFHFDTVQMPLNIMDAHYRSFAQLVLPQLIDQKIGALGMKTFGARVILKSGVVQPMDCLHYALNLPVSVVITGIDSQKILDQAFAAVKSFRPMTEHQVAELLAKTEAAAANGKYELFKTSVHFDGTAHHPEWLGPDNNSVQTLAG